MLHICPLDCNCASVLWHCWFGIRKSIRPVKIWVMRWLSVWSKVQIVFIWSSWCHMQVCISLQTDNYASTPPLKCMWPSWWHCHSLSLPSVRSRLVLPFWCWLTWVVPEKGPLNVCVCVCVVQLMPLLPKTASLHSLASFKSRLVLPFWYKLTRVVLEKRPLSGCSSSSSTRIMSCCTCVHLIVIDAIWIDNTDTDNEYCTVPLNL